jgi:hypothetical protein
MAVSPQNSGLANVATSIMTTPDKRQSQKPCNMIAFLDQASSINFSNLENRHRSSVTFDSL